MPHTIATVVYDWFIGTSLQQSRLGLLLGQTTLRGMQLVIELCERDHSDMDVASGSSGL
jgi:hypothetical protein